MSEQHYDVIVVGCGGVGCSALMHLADRGVKALGIDRFAPGHEFGASQGQTRVIRQAYFEHPDYVPLLKRAYELWTELEIRADERLFETVGVLQAGPAEGIVVSGVLQSAREHYLRVETFTQSEVLRQWPGYWIDPSWTAVFEQDAGFLHVERCVLAHERLARSAGAKILAGVEFLGWQASDSGPLRVQTTVGDFHADRLVIAAGPWANRIWSGLPIQILRKSTFWFETDDPIYEASQDCPAFLIDAPNGCFYSLPKVSPLGVKAAEHTGGQVVADPLLSSRALVEEEWSRTRDFVSKYLPRVSTRLTKHSICHYAITPDGHFLVDCHPEDHRVSFAVGLSGHGFKFTTVLGEILADLALTGRTSRPASFLGIDRFRLC